MFVALSLFFYISLPSSFENNYEVVVFGDEDRQQAEVKVTAKIKRRFLRENLLTGVIDIAGNEFTFTNIRNYIEGDRLSIVEKIASIKTIINKIKRDPYRLHYTTYNKTMNRIQSHLKFEMSKNRLHIEGRYLDEKGEFVHFSSQTNEES